MIFTPLELDGTYAIDLDRREDARGFFARLFCTEEFARHGLVTAWAQINNSFTAAEGTVRGLHFQRPPMAETKMIRCMRGAILDVIVDLRAGSSSYGRWNAVELTAETRRMLYVPKGFAHGFQTLAPDTELLYFHDTRYSPEHEAGLNAFGESLGIDWPRPVTDISDRDRRLPDLSDLESASA